MPSSWESFFVAQVGGTAALTGLLFVALSINLRQILDSASLVRRAGEAVVLLIQPTIMGLVMLVPAIALRSTGIAAIVVAGAGFLIVNRQLVRDYKPSRERPAYEFRMRVTIAEIALLPALVGAVLLLCGSNWGIYWIALGAVTGILAGIFDTWVLLIEILR
jgi:hypothetical protein